MPFKKTLIETRLSNKFHFEKSISTGRNPHERWSFFYKDKKIATTEFSRNLRKNDDIDDTLLKLISKEVRAPSLMFFKNMINCTESAESYLNTLKDQKLIN
jgi:hypothetical protein